MAPAASPLHPGPKVKDGVQQDPLDSSHIVHPALPSHESVCGSFLSVYSEPRVRRGRSAEHPSGLRNTSRGLWLRDQGGGRAKGGARAQGGWECPEQAPLAFWARWLFALGLSCIPLAPAQQMPNTLPSRDSQREMSGGTIHALQFDAEVSSWPCSPSSQRL